MFPICTIVRKITIYLSNPQTFNIKSRILLLILAKCWKKSEMKVVNYSHNPP